MNALIAISVHHKIVSCVQARLGQQVASVGQLGDDVYGNFFRNVLQVCNLLQSAISCAMTSTACLPLQHLLPMQGCFAGYDSSLLLIRTTRSYLQGWLTVNLWWEHQHLSWVL